MKINIHTFKVKFDVNFNVLSIAIVLLIVCSCNKKQVSNNADGALTKHEEFSQPEIPSDNIEYGLGESHNYIIKQLDNTKGLSNSSVNAIFQDSENLLWIGTWDGLNRYDGNNFKIFRPESNNENSISNQVILKTDEDDTGAIWVSTMHGINRYDKKTNTFQQFYFSRKIYLHLPNGMILNAIEPIQ